VISLQAAANGGRRTASEKKYDTERQTIDEAPQANAPHELHFLLETCEAARAVTTIDRAQSENVERQSPSSSWSLSGSVVALMSFIATAQP
jgi:hypothetical protein